LTDKEINQLIETAILKVKSEYQTRLLEKAARDEDYTAETLVKE